MLNNLDDRERLIVFGGIGLVIVLLFVNVVIKVFKFRNDLTEELIESKGNFIAMDRAIKDYNFYRSLKTGEEEDANQIFAKLDTIMVRYALKEKLYDIPKDSRTTEQRNYERLSIEIHFRSVVLQDIMKFIYDIEMNKQLNGKVTNLNFRKVMGKELYDVNLRISSYSRVKK
ncbi:MAG: hypothetical protein KDK36_17800 [Leptospiraceae bacterium]|nr:hypothetical protein [Leptospiraceae bacterium]